jgi:tetratricopeptide (TPR) repeat protein
MRRLVVLLLCGLAIFTSEAKTRADAPSDNDTQGAKIHFQAGEQYYLRGHYDEAIGEFREAYRLSQAAALLYNISQAYERMGDLPHARDYLQKYLDSGQADASEVPALREKLRGLDQRIRDAKPPEPKKPPPATTTPPVVPPPAPVPAPTPVQAEPSRPYKTWKWVAAGTGAGFLIVAALFAADAAKMAKDLETAANQTPKTRYVGDLPDKYDRGDRDSKLATAFGVGGVALAATGVVFFFLDRSSGSEEAPAGHATVVPVIAPGTAGAAASWSF